MSGKTKAQLLNEIEELKWYLNDARRQRNELQKEKENLIKEIDVDWSSRALEQEHTIAKMIEERKSLELALTKKMQEYDELKKALDIRNTQIQEKNKQLEEAISQRNDTQSVVDRLHDNCKSLQKDNEDLCKALYLFLDGSLLHVIKLRLMYRSGDWSPTEKGGKE